MTSKDLPLTDEQSKLMGKMAKRVRIKKREVIAVACLSYFDGYIPDPESEGVFLESYTRFVKQKQLPRC